MPANIDRIAKDVEYFKYNEGYYPHTLAELLTNENNGDKTYLTAILNNGHSRYDYQLASNGFVITVVSSPSLIDRRLEMVRQFTNGEAFGVENAASTNSNQSPETATKQSQK